MDDSKSAKDHIDIILLKSTFIGMILFALGINFMNKGFTFTNFILSTTLICMSLKFIFKLFSLYRRIFKHFFIDYFDVIILITPPLFYIIVGIVLLIIGDYQSYFFNALLYFITMRLTLYLTVYPYRNFVKFLAKED